MDFPSENGGQHLGRRVLDARTYWVACLGKDDGRTPEMDRTIADQIQSLAEGVVWKEASALYIFDSFATIDRIAWCLRSCSRVKDSFLVGSFTHKECRIVGPCRNPLIFDLVSFAAPLRSTVRKSRRPRRSVFTGFYEALENLVQAVR